MQISKQKYMEELNMKRRLLALTLSALMVTSLVACKSTTGTNEPQKTKLKVGMVTDSGTIDDKSFNQGTWEGVQKAKKDLGIDSNYLKPTSSTKTDLLKEIGNLYDTGYKFIVTPGYTFSPVIYDAQAKYKDAKFVLLDAAPGTEDGKTTLVAENTVSVFFAEHQSGFIAGVATALQLKTGKVGFIGGMEIPPVQKFNWGFQQGIAYANKNLGTSMTLNKEDVVYQGTFADSAAGQQIAAQMYNRGVKAIFAAAGGVGVGAINEAKQRVSKGQEVWIVGVDSDQYAQGIYSNNKSVILTSAIKRIDNATFTVIQDDLNGKFPGGKTLMFDATNDGIGIPAENPNLSKETTDKCASILADLKAGKIVVADKADGLIK